MSRNTYNGWSSRETWLINVWFNPESRADVVMARDMFYEALDAMPDFMHDFVDTSAIDWDELMEHFDEDEDEDEGEE